MQKNHLIDSNIHSQFKNLKKIAIERLYLNLMIGIYDKHTVNSILNGEKLKLGTKQGELLL